MNHKENANPDEICVYYNSACPVCNAGINYQKGKAVEKEFKWNDVHNDNRLAEELSSDLETLRKYLHVTDRHGSTHIGIDAFIVIWKNSDKQGYLATLFSLPLIHTMAKVAYHVFASALYRWNRWKKHW